jgi:O-antigen/teichoic acid export membrane protein
MYAFGTVTAGLVAMFSAIVVRVSLPALLRMREDSIQFGFLAGEIGRILWVVSSLSVVLVLAAALFVPAFIHLALPAYIDGIWTTTALACVGAFIGLSQAGADIVMSLGQKRRVLEATIVAVLTQALLIPVIWLVSGSSLVVAYAALGVLSIYAARLIYLCFRAAGLVGTQALIRTMKKIVIMVVLAALAPGLSMVQQVIVMALNHSKLQIMTVNGVLASLFAGAAFILLRRAWSVA